MKKFILILVALFATNLSANCAYANVMSTEKVKSNISWTVENDTPVSDDFIPSIIYRTDLKFENKAESLSYFAEMTQAHPEYCRRASKNIKSIRENETSKRKWFNLFSSYEAEGAINLLENACPAVKAEAEEIYRESVAFEESNQAPTDLYLAAFISHASQGPAAEDQ